MKIEYKDCELIVIDNDIELHYNLSNINLFVRRGYGTVKGYEFSSEKISGVYRWKKEGRGRIKNSIEIWAILSMADTIIAQQGYGFC